VSGWHPGNFCPDYFGIFPISKDFSHMSKKLDSTEIASVFDGPGHEIVTIEATPKSGVPIQAAAEIDRMAGLLQCLMRAGTLVLSADEQAGLREPFHGALVQRLPKGGLSYIPHIEVSRRLNAVLGTGQWCVVRLREWFDGSANIAYGSYALVVRGVWVADTVAGSPYYADNVRMDRADALEGTRGIALRRMAAKSLGCGDQVWSQARMPEPPPPPTPPPPPPTNGKAPSTTPPPANCPCGTVLVWLRNWAGQGTEALRRAWASLMPQQRQEQAGELSYLKQIASDVDDANEKRARG